MTCKMLEEISNPHLPRDRPPEDKDARIDWLVERHEGGRDAGCNWCLLVDALLTMQRRANAAELKLETHPLIQLARMTATKL